MIACIAEIRDVVELKLEFTFNCSRDLFLLDIKIHFWVNIREDEKKDLIEIKIGIYWMSKQCKWLWEWGSKGSWSECVNCNRLPSIRDLYLS